MNDGPLTVRELQQDIHVARQKAESAKDLLVSARRKETQAKLVYDKALNQAYVRAKEQGATEGLAKAKSELETETEHRAFLEAQDERRGYKDAYDVYYELVRGFSGMVYALNRELKLAEVAS